MSGSVPVSSACASLDNEVEIHAASANGSITVNMVLRGRAVPPSPLGSAPTAAWIIAWTRSVPADKQVETAPPPHTAISAAVASDGSTSHVQMLTGSARSTQYHYRVKSRDGNGAPTALSDDYSFATASDSGTSSISDVGSSGNGHLGDHPMGTTSRWADGLAGGVWHDLIFGELDGAGQSGCHRAQPDADRLKPSSALSGLIRRRIQQREFHR